MKNKYRVRWIEKYQTELVSYTNTSVAN